ncbi:restriction endonuclease subunit S [Enterococcus lactis]|uniref:restriction endonuclease subunit S n=1 Tax=Enterococcus lactis TaxID=357441 RepID=UPI0039A73603
MSNDIQPEIRFPGFTEDWEERKLSEMANFSKGNGYSKADLAEEGHPVILYGRLYTKYETIIENVDTFAELKEKSVISNGGEVIVPASGETPEDISRASVVDVSGIALGGDLNIIKTKSELDPIFLALTISNGSQQKEMTKRAQGKSVVHLHNSDLKEVNLLYPKLDEQVKIGSFFKKLDVSIALHQRKLDLLKETKKGFLQKMFPKNGAKVPEIRFPGFTEDWEQRKVGEIFKVTRGQVLAATETSESITEKNIYPVYSSQTKNDGLMGYYSDYLFDTAITWTTDGANAGTVNYRNGKFYSTNVNGVLLSDKGYANKAVAEIINRIAWKHVSKVGNPKLMNNVMSEIIITIPSVEEQETISRFFTQLDSTITLHERELDLLKETKKGFLQKMFV